MRLAEIFRQLTHGELATLAIGGLDGSGVLEQNHENLVAHVNLGLTELHKRFPLKTNQVMVQSYDAIQKYYLHSDYAETNENSNQPIKYIKDSIYEPFVDDVLKIESVYDEDGKELFMNDRNEYWSVHTPSYNCLQIPYPEKENAYSVLYRADHRKIIAKDLDPETEEVDLPYSHLSALLLFIASRKFSTNPTLKPQSADGNAYYSKFEAACAKLEELNIMNKSEESNIRLEINQWV